MRNLPAIGFGLLLIIIALVLAVRTTDQETTPRPQVAQGFATEMHTTPDAPRSPTTAPTLRPPRLPTVKRTSTPTPVRITRPKPSSSDILALLFQYPYQGTRVNTENARVTIQSATVNEMRLLLITGNGLEANRDPNPGSASYGAILSWEKGEYRVRFLRVEFARGDVSASFFTRAGGGLVLRFQPVDQGKAADDFLYHSIFLRPCDSDVADNPPSDMTERQCY